jgi:hypothetical protein
VDRAEFDPSCEAFAPDLQDFTDPAAPVPVSPTYLRMRRSASTI